jgi:hypothetical protein
MTINSVDLMWSRETSQDETPDQKTFTTTYGSAYQVVHSIDATLDEVRYAPAIYLGNSHPLNRFAYCTKVGTPNRVGPILSIVEIEWKGESVPGTQEDPTNQEPVIRYYSTTTTEAVDTDGYGFPLTNVNGDVMEGFTKEVSDMVLDIQRNYLAVSGKLALKYMDSTNSDAMNVFGDIWEPGSAAMQSFSINPVIKNGIVEYFNVQAQVLFRQAYNTVPLRAWWHRYRNEGLNERVGAVVAFSGGGGSGAAAYAIVSSGGAVTSIVVTNSGRDYTSAPTVAITSTTGTGSGASATATVADGKVASVSVGSGGTLYKSILVPALDGNKERVTKPVLLKANGTREYDASAAVWLERPKKTYSLPYNVLGLL